MTTPVTPEQAREIAADLILESRGEAAIHSLADQVEALTAERDALKDAARLALVALEKSTPKPRKGDDDYCERGWRDQSYAVAELRKALDEEMAQSLEPVAWAMCRSDGLVLDVICPDEHESYEGEYTMPLYPHPPQPQATTPAASTLTEALAQQGIKLRTEFEPKQRDSELATEPSGERAELIARLATQWAELDPADPYRADVGQAVSMLEADAQQAKRVPMTDREISEIVNRYYRLMGPAEFARAIEAHHGIGGEV